MIVSYFEWAQNLQQTFWSEAKVNNDLYRIISVAYHDVASLAASHKSTRHFFMVLLAAFAALALLMASVGPYGVIT